MIQTSKTNQPTIDIFHDSSESTTYKIKSENGEGLMTRYSIFDGIDLIYNDFHMGSYFTGSDPLNEGDFRTMDRVMEINHCREGRYECQLKNNAYVYLEKGDLAINPYSNSSVYASFPLSHYHGISVIINIDKAMGAISDISRAFGSFPIHLENLYNKLCSNESCFIARANESIDHIFSEIYFVQDKVKLAYMKLKVLELLLFLESADYNERHAEKLYYPKSVVENVKQIKSYLVEHIDKRITLKELADKYNIPLTTMKACFKGVYGMPMYTYVRSARMTIASSLLINTNEKVSNIAGKVGYENPSKFSAAFKDVVGVTPASYRKNYKLNGVFHDDTEWKIFF